MSINILNCVFTFEAENVYSGYFLVFNQNIEINRKLLKPLPGGRAD